METKYFHLKKKYVVLINKCWFYINKKKNLYNYYINIYYKVYLFIKGKKFFKI